jgi:hypothetical protein
MTQQITSYNLRHDGSAELMFIVYVMMIQHTMNVTSCGGYMTQHNDVMCGMNQHIMNEVVWGL